MTLFRNKGSTKYWLYIILICLSVHARLSKENFQYHPIHMQFCKILKLIKIGFIPHIYLVKSVNFVMFLSHRFTNRQFAHVAA
jgi:hypothetical protein